MAADYEKLYVHFKSLRKDVLIARIEASDNDDISLRYGIFSFPRVVLFGPDDPRIKAVFDGKPRTLQFFSEWINSETPVIQIKEEVENNHKKFISEEHIEKQESKTVETNANSDKNVKIGNFLFYFRFYW